MMLALVEGTKSRREVADWASEWVRLPDPDIRDQRLWQALTRLSGADLISVGNTYLHDETNLAT